MALRHLRHVATGSTAQCNTAKMILEGTSARKATVNARAMIHNGIVETANRAMLQRSRYNIIEELKNYQPHTWTE